MRSECHLGRKKSIFSGPTPSNGPVNGFARNKNIKSKRHIKQQCCGSGSTGSTCFWTSRIRIHKSEVWIRIRIWMLLSSCKNSKKNLDSYYFVTLFDFLSLKKDVNVPSKSNKQKKFNKKLVFDGILKVSDENSRIQIQDPDSDPNPDPLVRGMDPRIQIRIHTKMSWIRNTVKTVTLVILCT